MLKLKVISPEKTVLSADCKSVTLPTSEGQITVYPRHAPIYTLIVAGEVVARTATGDVSLGVGSGFANITNAGNAFDGNPHRIAVVSERQVAGDSY